MPGPRAFSGPGLASRQGGGSGTSCRMAGRVGWLSALLCAQLGTTSSHSIALGSSSYPSFATSAAESTEVWCFSQWAGMCVAGPGAQQSNHKGALGPSGAFAQAWPACRKE